MSYLLVWQGFLFASCYLRRSQPTFAAHVVLNLCHSHRARLIFSGMRPLPQLDVEAEASKRWVRCVGFVREALSKREVLVEYK